MSEEPTKEPTPETPPEPIPPAKNVVEALSRVMADLPGIGRTDRSEQGYQYRGIEAITRHAQGLFAKHGVVTVPRVARRTVKDFTINNRPWTEDELWVHYRFYGPAGTEDFIEVGPLVGLGRDNSDKGANKAMTQAYKYALVQVLCIGDGKDDVDAEPAREADRVEDRHAGEAAALRRRIDALTPEGRLALGSWCDDNKVPRRAFDMSEEQRDATGDFLDRLATAPAATDGPREHAPFCGLDKDHEGDCLYATDGDAESDEKPSDPVEGTDTAPDPESSQDDPVASETADSGTEQGTWEPTPERTEEEHVRYRDSVVAFVKGLRKPAIVFELNKRTLSTSGNADVLGLRLATALIEENWQPPNVPTGEPATA